MHSRRYYLQRHESRLKRRLLRYAQQDANLVRWRLLTGALGVLLIWVGFTQVNSLAGWSFVVLSGLSLSVLAVFHRRLRRGIAGHRAWLRLKRIHRARLEMNWDLIPEATPIDVSPEHPFAHDLDIVGPLSLHRFLDNSLSDGGSHQLAELLLAEVPHPQQILARQQLVRELREMPTFRDRLALEGLLVDSGQERWTVSALRHWLDLSQSQFVAGVILISWLLCLGNWGLFGVFLLGKGPPLWILSTTAYVALQVYWQSKVESSFKMTLNLERTIGQIRGVFCFLESYDLASAPAVARLCTVFNDPERWPSGQIRRLQRWIAALSVRAFPPAWLVCNLLIPWDLLALSRLEEGRRELRNSLVGWLDACFRLEAMTSLATFADLNRDYVFPHLEPSHGNRLRARALGHPLIPGSERVANDFELDSPGQVVIITGSNMSGKSTFLRTVGVNARLAYAGGPVCAEALDLSVLRIWAVIRLDDSLSEGYSFFFREVQRLRALLDDLEAQSQPAILYLIDEIFRGTNNRERLVGSRSYIRALSRQPCMGIVTTHDLDLVNLEKESDRVSNAHFREHIEAGSMKFDFKLNSGPCPTTNALEIMRMEGLPVDDT